jgi:hypothetical protein
MHPHSAETPTKDQTELRTATSNQAKDPATTRDSKFVSARGQTEIPGDRARRIFFDVRAISGLRMTGRTPFL